MTCGVFNGAVVLDDRLLKSDLFQKKARGTLTSSNGAEIPEYTAHGSNENGMSLFCSISVSNLTLLNI